MYLHCAVHTAESVIEFDILSLCTVERVNETILYMYSLHGRAQNVLMCCWCDGFFIDIAFTIKSNIFIYWMFNIMHKLHISCYKLLLKRIYMGNVSDIVSASKVIHSTL